MNSKKVVLISTYPDIQAYGLRMLSSVLKTQGFTTSIVFLNAPFGSLYNEKILKQVVELSRGSIFVGVSLMTNFFERARELSLFLKKHLKIPIVWGGIHTAIRPNECLDYADIICIGEAEDNIGHISERLMRSEDLGCVNNIWFNKNGKITRNKVAPLINDIINLPFPDYEYSNHFVIDNNRLVSMDLKLMEQYMGYAYQTIVTRGCYYNCSFCANSFLKKTYGLADTRKIRSRKIADVIKEFILIKKHLNYVRIFKFADELFLALSQEDIELFCKLYKESGLGLPLDISGVHPMLVKEEKLKLLIDAGLQYVRMGIQSGSEHIRRLYGRYETNSRILKGANILHKYKSGMKSIHYDFIVDNPWEGPEDIKESLRLLVKIPRPYRLNIFSLTLYPGTVLYDKAKNEGMLNDEFSQVYNKHYHDNVATSYYNELFKIISTYRLPKKAFNFLIENKSNLLAGTIYTILSGGVVFSIRIKRLIYLIKEGIAEVVHGRFIRINKFLFVRSKVVH